MKRNLNENKVGRAKRRKKPKHRTLRGLIKVVLVLCCFAVAILALDLFTDAFSFIKIKLLDNLAVNGVIDTDLSGSTQSESETEWYLILVNKWNFVPEDYAVELTELSNGRLVDSRIYPALQEMLDAARSDGVYPVVASGYRTEEEQQRLIDEKIAEYSAAGYSTEEAAIQAAEWVAPLGGSEHQLGIAVDINADGINSAGYEVYAWLDQNAHRFGFICRYPEDKIELTGVANEPWHYRYVGVEAATEIYNQGICLEEYLSKSS